MPPTSGGTSNEEMCTLHPMIEAERPLPLPYLKVIYDFLLLYLDTHISLASLNCNTFSPVYYYFGRQILVKCFCLAKIGAE